MPATTGPTSSSRSRPGLWDTWEDDALVLDRASGIFADPDKVHELDYEGEWFSARGPLTVPRSPQGRPVLLQAGSSGRGRDFAARWAELIFTGDPDIDIARAALQGPEGGDRRRRAGIPQSVKMLPMVYTVVGESHAHAEEREDLFLHSLVDPQASLTLLSELMNYDFSGLALDAPITDELIGSVSGIRGLVQNLRNAHRRGDGHPRRPGRSPGHPAPGPALRRHRPEVADQMEEWIEAEACDGFTVAATHSPGAYEDVVRLVVPELQRRGVFRDRYTGDTLRDTLGLARPEVGRSMPEDGADRSTACGWWTRRPWRRVRWWPPRWASSVPTSSRWSSPARATPCAPGATARTESDWCGRA